MSNVNLKSGVSLLTKEDISSASKDVFSILEEQQKDFNNNINKKELDTISKKMNIDVSKLNGTTLDDARMVNRIDEDFKRLNAYIVKKKNTCTFSEYKNNWFPMHELICSEMPDYEEKLRERRDLTIRYMDRFLTGYPIRIVSDHDPNEVLAVMPPMYMPINTVQGNASQIFDLYTNYAIKDIDHLTSQSGKLMSTIMYATQGKTPEQISDMRRITFEANLRVLKLFNPDHPLIKKIEELEKKKKELKDTKTDNIKNNESKEENVLDDDSNFDFF